MRARPQRLHQTLGEAPHLTPGRAPDSQRSRCENEVAVVSAVGLHLPQTRAFQLQPDHQLATQPGACRKASAPRHLAEVPASATVWKVRPQTLRWAGECGAVWGCDGKAGSSGGRVPIIPRPQACGRSGSRRSQGHRPCCGHAQHHQASAVSGRWAADNENRHHTSCPQSAPCLGHDPRKPDRTPPGQSPSCFQGNA